ncbi:MAG: hypothetical protein NTV68_05595 [Methanomicrobiales archaeon]|nr:hypothetical protein [Methanomicrobiales archaeon]
MKSSSCIMRALIPSFIPGLLITHTFSRRAQNYYTQHPDAGYAEAGKALGISRQVVRTNVLKMSQPAVGEV